MDRARTPNLLIAGVAKCATTSLFSYLSAHPEICGSTIKEINFFLPLRYGGTVPPLDQYTQYFRHARGERYLLEASPGYFFGGATLARAIVDQLGPIKVIVLLRDPVERLVSYYKHLIKLQKIPQTTTVDAYVERSLAARDRLPGWEHVDSNDAFFLRGLGAGIYVDHLAEWWAVFGDALRVVFFEQLKQNPARTLANLSQWLTVDGAFFGTQSLGVENRSFNYRHRRIHAAARTVNRRLEPFFRRYPTVKRNLLAIYCRINETAAHRASLSDAGRRTLTDWFAPHNRRLGALLSAHGYDAMPPWVSR